MEIERKWLFDMSKVPTELSETITNYKQAYISIEPEVRIRVKNIEGNPDNPRYDVVACESDTHMLCIKGNGKLARFEIQKDLSKQEFEELAEIGRITPEMFIDKHYYTIPVDKYILTVGMVDKGKSYQFAYGEIEFESEEEALNFEAPEWFGLEVTNDDSYKMKNYWKRTREIL